MIDFEAERRAREDAQRQQEEAERREQERLRAEKQRQFEAERDAAVRSLKGIGSPAAGLKGLAPAEPQLRTLQDSARREEAAAVAARREELQRLIQSDAEAIRRLGFARREEDFREWADLAAKAKAEFEGEVLDVLTDIAIDRTKGRILDTFKGFDIAKARRFSAWVRASGIKPEPKALLAAIERVGRAPNKARVTEDAEFIVEQLDNIRKGRAAAADPLESAKFVGGMLEGLLNDPRLKFLVTETKLATAAVYNNATRRVARAEVERLTVLTEQQLHDLDRLRKLLERHVQELNALKFAEGKP